MNKSESEAILSPIPPVHHSPDRHGAPCRSYLHVAARICWTSPFRLLTGRTATGRGMLVAACWCLLLASARISAAEIVQVATAGSDGIPKQPQAAVDATGTAHVVFGIGNDVFYCSSTGESDQFSQPTRAFTVPNLSLRMRRGPRICVSPSTIVITAIGGPQGKGRDGDLLAWHSLDRGRTWQGPARVNDTEASAREGLHAMASSGNIVWSVWLDLRDQRTELYGSRSTDGGRTWQQNQLIYRSPEKSICECCHPSAIMAGSSLVVMFRNALSGDRDMFLTKAQDENATFSAASPLGRGHWKLKACPMDGGMLTTLADGQLLTVWRREDAIYRCVEGEPEQLLGHGTQPWVAGNAQGHAIVWTSDRVGALLLQRPGLDAPAVLARDASDPVIVTGSSSSRALVLWEGRSQNGPAILAEFVSLLPTDR